VISIMTGEPAYLVAKKALALGRPLVLGPETMASGQVAQLGGV